MNRSPDLIFQKDLTERTIRLSSLFPLRDKLGNVGLDRITLFVTERCNLLCEYCNGPHMDPEKSLNEDLGLT